jgi:hypothetical protein
VCCNVLNLLVQVGLAPGVPPWLKPIALNPEEKDLFDNCWLKTRNAASRTQQGIFFIPQFKTSA